MWPPGPRRRDAARAPLLRFAVAALAAGVVASALLLRAPALAHPALTRRTSIAFYINIGHTHAVAPDLRGAFWEWQLPSPVLDAAVVYMGDGPCALLGGARCHVRRVGDLAAYVDERQCLRTEGGWAHFVAHNADKRWYFKGVHDTFVNVSLLEELLEELEAAGNPMTEALFAFNLHEYDGRLYPQGGSGWVFSNFVVQRLWRNLTDFHDVCEESFADDVALGRFLARLGWNVTDYQTSRFMPYWPLVKVDWDKAEPCPQNYTLVPGTMPLAPTPCRRLIAVHMHLVPMDKAAEEYRACPEGIALIADAPYTRFCRL
jgi:hypothetical protein